MPNKPQFKTFWLRLSSLIIMLSFCVCLVSFELTAQEDEVATESPTQAEETQENESSRTENSDDSSKSDSDNSSANESKEPGKKESPADDKTPEVFDPSENISEDYAVPFPVDI